MFHKVSVILSFKKKQESEFTGHSMITSFADLTFPTFRKMY